MQTNFHNVSRDEIETVTRIIRKALGAGYKISVNDSSDCGGDWVVKRSRDQAAILASMFSTEGDAFLIRDEADDRVGMIFFIYGNDGDDVVYDHTDNAAIASLVAA